MQLTEVKDRLEEWFNSVFPGEVCKKARVAYAKLKICSHTCSVPTPYNYYEKARAMLKDRGEFLEAEKNCRLLLATGSGKKNLNPTIVEICFEEQQLHISAWAKEGIFPQKSAPGAVSACLEAMKLN